MNVEGAIRYLVDDMQFDEQNARNRVTKFKKMKTAPKQMSLTGFIRKVNE